MCRAPFPAACPAAPEQVVLRLFDECGPALLRYVGSLGLSVDDAEDVVQDVFLLLFRHLSLGGDRTNLRGWVFQVARNLALKRRHALKRQTERLADDGLAASQADRSLDPEASLADTERRRLLRAVLHALPQRDRRCLSLRADGLRYRQIADVLGISIGTVAKILARSISRLMAAAER